MRRDQGPALRELIDQLLLHADEIVTMDDKKITASGSYSEIQSRKPGIVAKVQKPAANAPLATVEKSNFRLTVVENKDHTSNAVQTADNKKAMRVKRNGNWPVYTYYFRSAGYGILVSFLAFTIIEAFCSSFQSLSGFESH